MKTLKLTLIIILLQGLLISAHSQKYYDIIINKDSTEVGYSTFEDKEGYFVTIGSIRKKELEEGYKGNSLIVKFSDTSDILIKSFSKKDTSLVFQHGFQKENGNYYIIGRISDTVTPEYFEYIYLCEITPDFNLIWEKIHLNPEGNKVFLADFLIDNDNNIVIYTYMKIPPYSNKSLFLAKFDMNGNILISNFLPDYHADAYNEIVLKPDSSGYYMIGGLSIGSGLVKNWFEIDKELNIINTGVYFGGENLLGRPVSVKYLSNGNLFVVNRESQETPGAYADLEVRISDPDFNTIRDTVFIEPGSIYTPVYKGVDFVYEDLIWTCTFDQDFPFVSGNETFKVYLFDSEMNIKGMKVFGGDSRWWFMHLCATTDGGCIITGMKREPGGTTMNDLDLCVIRIMPEDILTIAEQTACKNDMDVSIFPNPFTNQLNIETVRKHLTIILYDFSGKMVLSEKIVNIPKTRISTELLQTGFYFYTISDNDHVIQSGKLINQ